MNLYYLKIIGEEDHKISINELVLSVLYQIIVDLLSRPRPGTDHFSLSKNGSLIIINGKPF
jgi:hypothetical protein